MLLALTMHHEGKWPDRQTSPPWISPEPFKSHLSQHSYLHPTAVNSIHLCVLKEHSFHHFSKRFRFSLHLRAVPWQYLHTTTEGKHAELLNLR